MTCQTCVHAVSLKEAGSTDLAKLKADALECHRYPPTVTPVVVPAPGGLAINAITSFPQVSAATRCGEFAPKPNA